MDFPKLYKQQHGQHRQEMIEERIKNATTANANINHHFNLHFESNTEMKKKNLKKGSDVNHIQNVNKGY